MLVGYGKDKIGANPPVTPTVPLSWALQEREREGDYKSYYLR